MSSLYLNPWIAFSFLCCLCNLWVCAEMKLIDFQDHYLRCFGLHTVVVFRLALHKVSWVRHYVWRGRAGFTLFTGTVLCIELSCSFPVSDVSDMTSKNPRVFWSNFANEAFAMRTASVICPLGLSRKNLCPGWVAGCIGQIFRRYACSGPEQS